MSWIGPAIQATDNLFQRIENRYQFNKANEFSAEQAQLQRDWESAEADKARQWQSNEWQRQFNLYNEYNTPSAQMARLKEAGLNPFLNQSSIGAGNSAPSGTPSASAPSGAAASSVTPPYGQIHEIGSLVLGAESVSANNANQRAQALQATVKTALEALKISPSASKEILKLGMSQYKFSDNDFGRANQLLNLEIRRNELQNDEHKLRNDLIEKYGAKKAQYELDLIDNQIVHIVASIGKMASDAEVNDSQIKKLASDVYRNFAEAGLFSAQSVQINSLMPYLLSKISFEVGTGAMSYLSNLAEFGADEKYRDWLGTDKAKESRKMSKVFDSSNNALNKFFQELNKMIPTGTIPSMLNNSPYGKRSFGFKYGMDW